MDYYKICIRLFPRFNYSDYNEFGIKYLQEYSRSCVAAFIAAKIMSEEDNVHIAANIGLDHIYPSDSLIKQKRISPRRYVAIVVSSYIENTFRK